MKKISIIGILLVLVFTLPVAAEFYRYQDEHGNTIFTDDYSKVPPDQRENAKSYEESISRPVTQKPEDQKEADSEQRSLNERDEKDRQRLLQLEKKLSKEYDSLASEREALDKEKSDAVTSAQRKAYNKKIVEYNARLKAYQEKRDAHAAEIDKFNKRISSKASGTESQ